MKKGIIRYDLITGFRNNLSKIIVFFVMITLINIIACTNIGDIESTYGIKATVTDYFCVIIGGPKYIFEGALETYQIPVLWLLPQIMISYIVGYYAMTDIDKEGVQMLVRANTRRKWWISKCIWNGTMIIFLYLVMYGVTFVNALANEAEMKYDFTQEVINNLCEIYSVTGSKTEVILTLIFMPLLVSITLNMMQMTIALIFSPIVGFICSQSIVFLSTIITNKWLISNYGMLSHSKLTCMSDIVLKEGIIRCVVLYAIAVFVGNVYFRRYDVVVRGE
ncbi:MAG: hypothetical protein IJA34_09075 [Lachnospiraceae bacterium]|nr:hypothetical protein [Lachnospiraceae bacterium]